MKAIFTSFSLIAFYSSMLAAELSVNKLFVADGFDINDLAEVTVQGSFSDSCYRLEQAGVNIDHSSKIISITINYSHPQRSFCTQMISPFTQTINIGRLPEGTYTVKLSHKTLEEKLVINAARSDDVDDYIYAPVEYTDVQELSSGELQITMKGRYPLQKRGCMRIVNLVVDSHKKDVVVIQPITELKDDAYCQAHPENPDFSSVAIIPNIYKGRKLIHVRVLNGESYNRVVE